MDHGYYRDRISAYLDKELPPYEEQAVGEHLKECAECRELLSKLEKMDQLVAQHSQLGEEDYWEQAAQRIEQQLENPQPEEKITAPLRWRGLGWKLIAAAASIAVITFIGLHKKDISIEPPTSLKQESPAVVIEKPKPASPVVIDTVIANMQKTTYPEEESIKETTSARLEETSQPQAPVRKNTKPKIKITGQQTTAKEDLERKPVTAGETTSVSLEKAYQSKAPIRKKTKPQIKTTGQQATSREEIKKQPVTTVEDLLEHFAQPDSNRSGYIRINGVEMGDTDYRPDTTPYPSGVMFSVEQIHWMSCRDSLQTLWDSLQEDERKLTLKKASPKKSLSSIDTVEMQLLESYYNVAIYTHKSDPQESDKAIEFFKQYLKRNDIRHRAEARNYLRRLEVELK